MVNERSTDEAPLAGAFVDLDGVEVRYGSGEAVLRDVSLLIQPRSFQFLTGPSGAGKTTLLRLMMLSVRPSRGLMYLFGAESAGIAGTALTSLRRRVGVVFQDFRLLDHLSVYENVALPLRVQGRDEIGYRAEVVELIEWVGLGTKLAHQPTVLSGGEKQRAAIARAVIARPDLVLADEPTGNVDGALAGRLLHLLVELHRMGTAVLVATHDSSLMERVDARRLVLADGCLSANG